jgi:SAM-dependent methyltransferase
MIRQRVPGSAPVIQALAGNLPFDDGTFDAGLAVLTIHHWDNRHQGLQELIRVVRGRIVIMTYNPASRGFWLVEDYFPEILDIDRRILPSMEELRDSLGEITSILCPSPTTALMVSWARTGAAPRCIWMNGSGGRFQALARFKTSGRVWPGFSGIWPMARGNDATGGCLGNLSLTWAIAWWCALKRS